MRFHNGVRQITTDRFDNCGPHLQGILDWHDGLQINGATRKELAMHATAPAKKVARQAKHAAIKKKSTSELNEPAEWSHRTVKKKKKKKEEEEEEEACRPNCKQR